MRVRPRLGHAARPSLLQTLDKIPYVIGPGKHRSPLPPHSALHLHRPRESPQSNFLKPSCDVSEKKQSTTMLHCSHGSLIGGGPVVYDHWIAPFALLHRTTNAEVAILKSPSGTTAIEKQLASVSLAEHELSSSRTAPSLSIVTPGAIEKHAELVARAVLLLSIHKLPPFTAIGELSIMTPELPNPATVSSLLLITKPLSSVNITADDTSDMAEPAVAPIVQCNTTHKLSDVTVTGDWSRLSP